MFNAFISYSHEADDKFAPALQSALQKFAKPWYKKRNLEIFRDESSLSASPHLWDNITKALDESEYFILLASPLSEKSEWVNKEAEYWLEHKSIETILIALTEGEMKWDTKNNCYQDPDNNSLPPALDDQFTGEPFYIDLRQSKIEEDISLDNPIFKKEVLKLAAKLHNKTPNDLASEEVTTHRNMVLLRNSIFAVLIVLLGFSIIQTKKANKQTELANEERGNAENQTKIAKEQTKMALSSSLTASSNLYNQTNATLSFRLAEYALQYDNTSIESYAALLRAFYSNLHYYNNQLHSNTFYDEDVQNVPPVQKKPPKTHWPHNFIAGKGIELWGEYMAMGDVIHSPKKDLALFYYFPESDNGGYMIELWDLKNRYNKTGGGRWNEEDGTLYDSPMYQQYLSYSQIGGFDETIFSFDNKYVVVPKDNNATIIRVSKEQEEYHGRAFDTYGIEPLQFNVSSSNSQVVRASFISSNHIISTINLKSDTTSFNLNKMPLTTMPFSKTNLYSDLNGQYVLAVNGQSATIWNLEGEVLGKGVLNEELDRLISAPESFENFDQTKLTKVLSSKYSDSHGFKEDLRAISSKGLFEMNGSKVTDSLGNTVVSLIGHSENIVSVDISEDATLMLTATCPRIGVPETKLWDNNGNELLSLSGFGGKVGFLPGGRAFYTYTVRCCLECDSDPNIVIWPIDKDLLKNWVGKNRIYNLTREEIVQFGIDSTLLSTVPK